MRIFADTSFYVAVVSRNDALHQAAIDFSGKYKGRIITTEYVLVETGNWLGSVGNKNAFVALNRQIARDEKTLVIPADNNLYESGVALFAKYADKKWSLTDCISFVVMRQFHLTHALSADKHFQQAGFTLALM